MGGGYFLVGLSKISHLVEGWWEYVKHKRTAFKNCIANQCFRQTIQNLVDSFKLKYRVRKSNWRTYITNWHLYSNVKDPSMQSNRCAIFWHTPILQQHIYSHFWKVFRPIYVYASNITIRAYNNICSNWNEQKHNIYIFRAWIFGGYKDSIAPTRGCAIC